MKLSPLPVAIVDDRRFDQHRSAEPHPERPERLAAARKGLGAAISSSQRLEVAARPATEEELLRAHAPEYLERLKQTLTRGWGYLDGDTYFCPDTREAAWLAAGGAVELCDAILDGRASRGLALLRPPGHHACRSRSMGFCLLNNVAVAAGAALDRGLDRVAIVDWDVHHGNGTQEIFYEDERVLFISTHQWPLYPGTGSARETGSGKGAGYTLNVPMPPGAGPEAYGEAFRSVVLPKLREFEADLVLVSSGLDAHRRDPLAEVQLDAEAFGAMTTALCRHVDELGHGRLGLYLEGGYDLDAIEDSTAEILGALLGRVRDLPG